MLNEGEIVSENIQSIKIENLHLDPDNPRFGSELNSTNEVEILDHIVESFGVDDILGSLSINGFFAAESLVGIPVESNDGHYTIIEGNRRLAACLIFNGDERAINQLKRTKHYANIADKHRVEKIVEVPVNIYPSRKKLLSYLGIRHILGPKGWDSYAKATWLFNVLIKENSGQTIKEVSEMIGDKHHTIKKILEGYVLIKQLESNGLFSPDDSMRKGKGSNTDYPFSWVYTAIGYSNIRNWINAKDLDTNTIPDKNYKLVDGPQDLENAAKLVKFLFGSESSSFNPSVKDSRDIRIIAEIVKNDEQIRALEKGRSIDEVKKLSEPLNKRVSDLLIDTKQNLETLVQLVGSAEDNDMIHYPQAIEFTKRSLKLNKNLLLLLEDQNIDE